MYRYLFGPVPSRRLGRSLGIDLIPLKTCTFNCIFCEVGLTTRLTQIRKEYVPESDILSELREWVASGDKADFITLAGSGEPTLHSSFGSIGQKAAALTGTPVALLSNGSLFSLPEVRKDAFTLNLVKVSLSAWNESSFHLINQPHPSITFSSVVNGLKRFRHEFSGTLWLEVMIIKNFNDNEEAMEAIAKFAREISPDRIHLNTPVRPTPRKMAKMVEPARLAGLAQIFTPMADIPESYEKNGAESNLSSKGLILQMLKRRPCRIKDMLDSTGLPESTLIPLLNTMIKAGSVISIQHENDVFYKAEK